MMQTMEDKMRDKLFLAAQKGDLDKFKELLEDPEINKYLDILDNGYQTLKVAASHCNEQFLEYVYNRPEVNDDVMKKVISYAFMNGCKENDMKTLQFYFNHSKYGKYLDINYNSTWCFGKAYENENHEALQFLIINACLPKMKMLLST